MSLTNSTLRQFGRAFISEFTQLFSGSVSESDADGLVAQGDDRKESDENGMAPITFDTSPEKLIAIQAWLNNYYLFMTIILGTEFSHVDFFAADMTPAKMTAAMLHVYSMGYLCSKKLAQTIGIH